jgi:hypothetical protein
VARGWPKKSDELRETHLRPSPDHVYRFSGSSWRNRQAEGIVCILHHWCSGLRRQTSPNRDTRFIDGIVVSSSVSSDGIKKSGAPLSPMATYRRIGFGLPGAFLASTLQWVDTQPQTEDHRRATPVRNRCMGNFRVSTGRSVSASCRSSATANWHRCLVSSVGSLRECARAPPACEFHLNRFFFQRGTAP